ncbi:MAG: GC-type dockerin domain-anchored protein, partial [Planctomycetota bacterium]
IGVERHRAAYVTVVWILGEESSNNATLDAIEQSLVEDHLADGGSLFVSGAEIGWDMDALGNAIGFYNNTLRADFVADDALTYSAAGVPGSAFDGLSVDFDDGNVVYDANFCDVIAPSNGSSLAMTYLGGLGGGAAVQFAGGANDGRLIMLGFPFETILTTGDRAGIMGAALAYLDPAPVCVADVTTESTSNGVPDGLVTLSDFSYYLSLWATGDSAADITTTGVCDPGNAGDGVDLSDFSCYLTEWSAGCP